MPIAHRRTPADRAQQRPRYPSGSVVPLPGVERALVVAEEPKGDTQACYSMAVPIASGASRSTCPDARPFAGRRAFASFAGGVGGPGGRASYTTAPVAAASLRSAQNIPGSDRKSVV